MKKPDLCDLCQKHQKGTNDTLCLSCRLEVERAMRLKMDYLR